MKGILVIFFIIASLEACKITLNCEQCIEAGCVFILHKGEGACVPSQSARDGIILSLAIQCRVIKTTTKELSSSPSTPETQVPIEGEKAEKVNFQHILDNGKMKASNERMEGNGPEGTSSTRSETDEGEVGRYDHNNVMKIINLIPPHKYGVTEGRNRWNFISCLHQLILQMQFHHDRKRGQLPVKLMNKRIDRCMRLAV